MSFCHLIFIDQIEQLSLRLDDETDASQHLKDNLVGSNNNNNSIFFNVSFTLVLALIYINIKQS